MNDADLVNRVTEAAAAAPKAEPAPKRSDIAREIDDAFHRMTSATTAESKMVWAKRYVDAKKRRGDFEAEGIQNDG